MTPWLFWVLGTCHLFMSLLIWGLRRLMTPLANTFGISFPFDIMERRSSLPFVSAVSRIARDWALTRRATNSRLLVCLKNYDCSFELRNFVILWLVQDTLSVFSSQHHNLISIADGKKFKKIVATMYTKNVMTVPTEDWEDTSVKPLQLMTRS